MECTLYSDRDVYLVNNISGWSNTADDDYKSKGVWDGTQDVYQFTISGATLSTNEFQFRLKASDENFQISPNGNYPFNFSLNGKWNSYDSYNNNNDNKNEGVSFQIDHPNINAAEYKITVYIRYADWGRTYTTKAEIVSMPVTLSTTKGTFSCDRALDFTGKGIDAYMITGASNGVLTLSSDMTKVPASTGLYLEGSAGTVNVPVITTDDASAISTTGNMLKPGTGSKINQTVDIDEVNYTNFILTTNKGASAPKFYKVNASGNTVGVGKAYLQIPTATVGAREFFWFDEESGTTSVNDVRDKMEDVRGDYFNLAGQRVAQPTKGLYIVNGKKVLVK